MAKMGPWGSMPDALRRAPGLPFLSAGPRDLPADRGPARDAGAAALMAERERLSGEIEYLDAQSLPRARETALNSALLAESRRTESALERALALGGKVETMKARRAALQRELGDVKARLCETLMSAAGSRKDGGPR